MIGSMCAGTRIRHINCSAPTCCDDLAVLAILAIVLRMILNIVEYYKTGTAMAFRQKVF